MNSPSAPHSARAPLRVHARAAQLDGLAEHRPHSLQVEFGLGVEAASTPCRIGCEHTVGADDFALFVAHRCGTHQQVFAESIEAVDVVTGRRTGERRELRAHLVHENSVAQALRLAHFAQVLSP
jgi:hypothetical protein